MKNIVIEDFPGTSPPSVMIAMLIETEADKALIAEFMDHPTAKRCPDQKICEQVMCGRILGGTLNMHLSAPEVITNREYVERVMKRCREETGLNNEEILRKMFYFRFFNY